MAIDKKLQIFDNEGNPVDYDILASDVKFLPDGKDLPTKLAEMEEEIDDAGGGYTPPVGGIPKSDLASDVQNTLDDVAGKVDKVTGKGLSTNDYTTEEKTKLGNLPTADQLTSQMNAKADDNAVVKTVSVNGGTPQSPFNGNVDISVEGGGSVESVTVNGTKHTPDANGDVNLGTIQGEKGDKGDTGNVIVSDGVAQIGIINDLTTGGTGDALSAEMGKRLKNKIDEVHANIQRLFNNLANMAFWDATAKAAAAPHPINWGGSTYTVALNLMLNNAVVKHNGVAKANEESIQVEEGGTLTLTIEPESSSYAFASAPSASVNGTNINPVINQDGSYTINVPIGQSDVTLVISAIAVAARNINVVVKKITAIPSVDNSGTLSVNPPTMTSEIDTNTGCGVAGAERVVNGGAYNGIINIASNYGMFSAKMTMGGTDISDKINLETGAISIAAVTGDITITLTVAEAVDGMFVNKSFYDNSGDFVEVAYCGTLISGGVPTNGSPNDENDDWCCNAEFFSVPAGANKIKLVHGPILTAKTDGNNIQNKRGCLIVYNAFGVRVGHITIYNANETERELNFPLPESAQSDVSAYVRGSFIKNKLGVSKILFSTDGGTTWIDKFDGSEKDITTT